MKKLLIIAITAFTLASCGTSSTGGKKIAMKNEADSFAYVFGANTGRILKNFKVTEINWDIFKACVEDVMKNGDSNLLISKEMENEIAMNYLNEIKYGENKTKGIEYIKKREKDGFAKNASGLLYKEVAKGNGIKPLITDTVFVHYTGKYVDGTVFDSSKDRTPLKTALNGGAIPGFLEAISLMEVGSKAEVIIPYEIAYGKQGNQNPYTGEMTIEPYQTLIFELELVDIKK
jgi:FKBP-type peptidyl-prolyl cis-trans isomerase FklB